MNPEEGKEDERLSAYRRWRLNMVIVFKMWKDNCREEIVLRREDVN